MHVHLTSTQLREIEADHEDELERIGNMRRAESADERQLSIFDALSAADLRAYLGGRA